MELFIVIVAVIAVVAALFLLLLLQIRIKKHSLDNALGTATCETSVAEIAAADPNDPYFKTGPPPYIEVMKSPERYPLSTKKMWDELVTAVLKSEDLVPSSPLEKVTTGHEINKCLSTQQNTASSGSSTIINVQEMSVQETTTTDDRLPSYHEVCSGRLSPEHTNIDQRDCSISQSGESELELCQLVAYNRIVERTVMNETNCAFTVANTLERVLVDDARSRATTL